MKVNGDKISLIGGEILKRICTFILIFIFSLTSGCSLNSTSSTAVNNSEHNNFSEDSVPNGTVIFNGNVPASAKYIDSLNATTPVLADSHKLMERIASKLGRNPKILVSSLHMTNDWNRIVSGNAKNTLQGAGAEVVATNAEGSWNKQVSDIESAIEDKVDAIIVAGGIAESLQEIIKKAADKGIPVITIDIPSPYALTNVTADHYSAGAMIAMKMALDMEGKGNIAVIYSPSWHSINVRRMMLDAVLNDWPKISIAVEQPVDEEDAINGTMITIESLLQKYPEKGSIKAVYTSFGLAGIGAAKAIEAAGLSKDISVYTVDADIMVLRDILDKDGAIKACICQTTTQLGCTAAVMALKGIVGETTDIKKQTFCPISLVTRENANEVGAYLYGEEWK